MPLTRPTSASGPAGHARSVRQGRHPRLVGGRSRWPRRLRRSRPRGALRGRSARAGPSRARSSGRGTPPPNASPAPTVSTTATAGTGTSKAPGRGHDANIGAGRRSRATTAGPRSRSAARGLGGVGAGREIGEVVGADLDDVGAGDDRAADPVEVARRGRAMTRGRQFGSSMTRVSPDRLPAMPAASADAIGSRTRPSVPTWNAAGRVARAAATASSAQVRRRRARPCGTGRSPRRARRARRPRASSARRSSRSSTGRRRRARARRASRAPNRSVERQPRNATSPPSRPIVRAVLNGPPPGPAASRPSGRTRRSMRASPATTIMDAHGTGATYPAPRWTAAPTPSSCSTARSTTRSTLAGNLRDLRRINRWLGGVDLSATAIDALAAHRDEPDPARRRDRRRGHPAGAPRAGAARGRRLSVVALDSRPGGPRGGRARDARPARRPRARAARRRRARRSPSPTGRSTSPTASLVAPPPATRTRPSRCCARWRRVARLGVVVNDLDRTPARLDRRVADGPPPDRATGTRGRTRRCRSGGRTAPSEMAAMLRAAGLTPVRTLRGSFGQRYAIAAVPTPDGADRRAPDPQGVGE